MPRLNENAFFSSVPNSSDLLYFAGKSPLKGYCLKCYLH